MSYKFKPSRKAAHAFAEKMNDISDFCAENGITQSRNGDSYYFTINGKNYRVSNHSIEASNARAYNALGERIREVYHAEGREENTIYIHASKTRIKEIYTDIENGYILDGRGNRK